MKKCAFKEEQHIVNILCSIRTANAGRSLEMYRFFRDALQASFLQFIPIVERATPETLPLADQGWGDRPGTGRPLYTQRRTSDIRGGLIFLKAGPRLFMADKVFIVHLGDDSFIETMGLILGRNLKPQKPGPKKAK